MEILNSIKELSTQGIINILSSHKHVNIDTCETVQELQEVLQCNINDGLIDEIEIILELSAE